MPSSTGATHGRAGGVAGAGSRAARALAAAPRVVPVGTLRTPLGPLNGAVPDAPSKKRKAAAVAGIEASEELSAFFDFSPGTAKKVKAVVGAGIMAALGTAAALEVEPAPPPAPRAGGMAGGTRTVPTLPRYNAAGEAPTPPRLVLGQQKRGELVVVQAATKYGAGSTYDWADVCTACAAVEGRTASMATVVNKYGIPRSSLNRWLMDDAEWMREHGGGAKGVPGSAQCFERRAVFVHYKYKFLLVYIRSSI